MYHDLLRDASFWTFLFAVDEDLAATTPQAGMLVRRAAALCQLPSQATRWMRESAGILRLPPEFLL